MEDHFKRALKLLRVEIINDFDPTYLWEEVLEDQSQTEEIKNGMTYSKSSDFEEKRRFWVGHLLDILPTKSNSAFASFVRNIRVGCHQDHLATLLEDKEKCLRSANKTPTPIQKSGSAYANFNLDELLGLNQAPRRLFSNRIRICDLKKASKEQTGVIQFQVIHKMVKSVTKGILYSFFIADESGEINLLANEANGKALEKMLKIKGFYQVSSWKMAKRNTAGLSNHDFELWIDQLPSVVEIQMLADADNRPIMPLRDLKLTTVDRILFEPEGSVDVIGVVHKVYKGSEKQKKMIELKNSKSKKNENIIKVNCYLFGDNVDFITKQDTIVVIKGASVKSSSKQNILWATSGSFIFLVNDSFEESWIPEDQHSLIKSLKPKPKPRSSSDLTNDIERALNEAPDPVQPQRTGSNNVGAAQICNRTTPSSSTPKVKAESTPRRGVRRKNSLLDFVKKSKRGDRVESTWVSDLKLVQVTVDTYNGCPNDNCTKKVEGNVTTPYLCDHFRCKNSPMKNETKWRYLITCIVCNEDAPHFTIRVKAFDKVSRQLLELAAVDPSSTNDGIIDKLKSHIYEMHISGKRNERARDTWDYAIENVKLSA